MSEEKCVEEFINQVMCKYAEKIDVFSKPWIQAVINTESNRMFRNMIQMISFLPEDYLSGSYSDEEMKKIILDNIRAQHGSEFTESIIQSEAARNFTIYSAWKKQILKA